MAHVALRLHETFHHKIESAAIRMETISQTEKYKPYDDRVYRPLLQARSDSLLEEGLANSWMYGQRDSDSEGIDQDVLIGYQAFLEWWVPTMPFAYGRGIELFNNFEERLYLLTEQIHIARPDANERRNLWR